MESFEKLNDTKEPKEIEEFIKAYCELEYQIKNPTRDGMIRALSDAQKIAYNEIMEIEKVHGNIRFIPWNELTNHDLICKLPKYKQGLNNHAVNKFGEETFKHLLEKHIKMNQDQ